MTAGQGEIDYEAGLRLVQKILSQGNLLRATNWADHLCRNRPGDPRAHNQAGLVRQRSGKPVEALDHFRRALVLQPDSGEVWVNLGLALRQTATHALALPCRRRAAWCRPDLPEVRLALAFGLLAAGDLRGGFAEYEHRGERARILARYAERGMAPWNGGDPAGRRLLVATEQGAGDTIQFLRFVKPLADLGAIVTVACPAALERLVRSAPGVTATVPPFPKTPSEFGEAVELLMSLPARFGIDLETLPAPAPYIDPPAPRHRVSGGGLRVGLCWTGSTQTPLNVLRQIPFDALDPVLAVDGPSFYGLQVLVGREALAGETRLTDLAPHIDDFADTAAMVAQMDLVITVDTSVAHIAGALGRPVWTLLATAPDWRWGCESATSPWYPSMRLFRQTRAGDWSDVLERVAAALRQVALRSSGGTAVSGEMRRPFASPGSSG